MHLSTQQLTVPCLQFSVDGLFGEYWWSWRVQLVHFCASAFYFGIQLGA